MKLKQLFKSAAAPKKIKVKEGAVVTEGDDLTTITDADYTEWCSQIGMKGQKVPADEFKDAAWEVIDNDPKLEGTSEKEKGAIISKLWKLHNSK